MVLECRSFIRDMFLQVRHIRNGIHVQVLIICENEDDVGLLPQLMIQERSLIGSI